MIERIMLELLGTHSVGSLLSRDVLGTLSSTITFVFHPHAVRSSVGSHPADKAPRLFEQPDPVGAFLIHALLVCNTDPALELAFKLLSVMPKLMLQVHTGQPFQDETALHVLSVNRREHLAIEYVDMVVARFEPEQVSKSVSQSVTWSSPTLRLSRYAHTRAATNPCLWCAS